MYDIVVMFIVFTYRRDKSIPKSYIGTAMPHDKLETTCSFQGILAGNVWNRTIYYAKIGIWLPEHIH